MGTRGTSIRGSGQGGLCLDYLNLNKTCSSKTVSNIPYVRAYSHLRDKMVLRLWLHPTGTHGSLASLEHADALKILGEVGGGS